MVKILLWFVLIIGIACLLSVNGKGLPSSEIMIAFISGTILLSSALTMLLKHNIREVFFRKSTVWIIALTAHTFTCCNLWNKIENIPACKFVAIVTGVFFVLCLIDALFPKRKNGGKNESDETGLSPLPEPVTPKNPVATMSITKIPLDD